ncbi:muscle M-line assembly protein unc-89-like [Amphiura filiformis]|uniref:muscle M-line assembly protein unc-89-like n=1 Tax=Amphiura filiformis TaxID=82378 RepID=UPI003B21ECD4
MTFSLFFLALACHYCFNVMVITASSVETGPRVAQFASLEVFEGQSVELPCTISATIATKVCWHIASDHAVQTGSRYIQFCEDPERTSEHDGGRHEIIADEKLGIYNLKIDPVIKSDSGLYMCSIINELGIAVLFGSGRVSVVDSFPPSGDPECKFSARDVLQEGDMLSASCFAVEDGESPGIPLASLQWLDRNNEPIGQTMFAQANQINWEVSANDAGAVYKCIVRHIAMNNTRNCTVGPLNVFYRPILEIMAKPSKPEMGGNVTIVCTAKGNPGVSAIKWFIKDIPIIDYENTLDYSVITKMDTSRLTLFDLNEEQFNTTITCLAENEQGQRNTSIVLTKPPDPPIYRNYNNLRTVLILDLVALALIVFLSVCVLGCWSSWTNLSRRIRAKCGCFPSASPHHVPL